MPNRIIHPKRQSRMDIELDLMPTDRILQRWSRSVGNDLPRESWDETQPPSQATELPEDAAIEVDRAVCQAPDQVRKFVHAWYRGQDPSAEIGRRFGMDGNAVYLYWRAILWRFQPIFRGLPCVAVLMQKHLEALEAA